MTLADLFEQLKYGELAHLAVGRLETDEQKKQVIAHINLGLLELHKRFWIISKNVVVQRYDYVYEYKLDSSYLVSNQISPEPYRYLIDSVFMPFTDDLIKVETLYDPDARELPLNDVNLAEGPPSTRYISLPGHASSFFTPQYNILRMPTDYLSESVTVQYRANHPKLGLGCNAELTEIELPQVFLEPLLLFVGHRASRILNPDQNQESNNYLKQFEMACSNIKQWGLEIGSRATNVKLDTNGWA